MSTVLPAVSANDSSPVARQRIAVPAWLREPLLHFVVLGAVLFGVDQFIVGRSDDPRVIVIDARVDEQARKNIQ